MASKQSFYEGIDKDVEPNEIFFKKVYGYSISDNLFLPAVATKLIGLGRKDVVQPIERLAENSADVKVMFQKVYSLRLSS